MSKYHPELTDHHDTRAKIFTAAAKLFAEKGYNGVSMREISETAGLSKPTIYYYFGNKEGIYTALLESSLHYQMELFQEISGRNIPIKSKIVEIIKLRFQQVKDYPEFAKFFLLLFMSFERLPFLENFFVEAKARRQMLMELIKQGVIDGEFGPRANPEVTAEILVGALTHYILKQLNSKENVLSDHLAKDIVEMLFRGLNE